MRANTAIFIAPALPVLYWRMNSVKHACQKIYRGQLKETFNLLITSNATQI